MVTNYQRGYATELKAKKELEAEGYYVIRASGSHGVFDIIATRRWDKIPPMFDGKHYRWTDEESISIDGVSIRFIQLKRVKGKYYSFKEEIKQIEVTKLHPYFFKELWIRLDPIKGIRKGHWVKQVIE